MNLTQLIAEQNQELIDKMGLAGETGFKEFNPCADSGYSLNEDKLKNWHTTSIIQILEAIVGEMEKSKDTTNYMKDLDVKSYSKALSVNETLDTQINNLTAVIESLKQI